MRHIITLSLLLLLMMPLSVKAAVVINEIAWMGDAVSANHEWLELYNNGDSSISLDGWLIKDGLNLEIPLSGNIGALDYAVLERTSEESAPGTALLIYTGALVNTGTTLTLYSAGGEIADQVAGGENWAGVGGDNTTKETAQYTSSGWVTDNATPGAINKTGREEPESADNPTPVSVAINDSNNESKVKTSSNKNDTVRLVTLDTELKLKLDFQTLAYVNQPVNFTVEASGIGDNIINSLNYTWNFGDTNTSSAKMATHAYAYPGTYVVTLRANFARHNEVVRQEITILPVTLSITKNEAGDIQINNNAPYDVELSGFTIRAVRDFIFPPDTIIIPRGTITIKASRLGLQNKTQLVALLDQEKTIVASTVGLVALPKTPAESLAVAKLSTFRAPKIAEINSPKTTDLVPETATYNFSQSANLSPDQSENAVVSEVVSKKSSSILATPEASASEGKTAQVETNKNQSTDNSWPYLALIGLLFLGFVGLLLRSNNSPQE